jgi:hypothetical protein
MRKLPECSATKSVNRKLLNVSAQNLAITALTLIVWDRSEIMFLKAFCDVRQLAFYSVAFSVAGYLALLPNVIGAAVGANVMAEYARARSRTSVIAENSMRYPGTDCAASELRHSGVKWARHPCGVRAAVRRRDSGSRHYRRAGHSESVLLAAIHHSFGG